MGGTLKKMATTLGDVVEYELRIGDEHIPLNPLLGKPIHLTYTGNIYCDACGRATNKSFAQGHCYPCMSSLARCDMCILKPETCHFAAGTCREPEWGERNCMIEHVVYLANTSGLKVGITRHSQIPTRWMDQGATQAMPMFRVRTRHIAGLVETDMATRMADKTNWRALLKGNGDPIDLAASAAAAEPELIPALEALVDARGDDAVTRVKEDVVTIRYPVLEFPTKITSHNFDKNPAVSGTLIGIKGQYLIFDTGVINMRKFTGYEVEFDA